MENTEMDIREKLIDQIEGYYGPMDNVHKLSTGELSIIANTIKQVQELTSKHRVKIWTEIKNRKY